MIAVATRQICPKIRPTAVSRIRRWSRKSGFAVKSPTQTSGAACRASTRDSSPCERCCRTTRVKNSARWVTRGYFRQAWLLLATKSVCVRDLHKRKTWSPQTSRYSYFFLARTRAKCSRIVVGKQFFFVALRRIVTQHACLSGGFLLLKHEAVVLLKICRASRQPRAPW